MTLLSGGGALQKNKAIAYGCLALLGSASVAGAVKVEESHHNITKLIGKIGEFFKEDSKKSQEPQPTPKEDVIGPFFVETGKRIAGVATDTVWPLLQSGFNAFTSIGEIYNNWSSTLKNFFTSLIDVNVVKQFFTNIHMKIYKSLSFFIAGDNRDKFLNLFREDKKEGTGETIKFLLGKPFNLGEGHAFQASPDLFHFLLFKWLDDPEKMTVKFERLFKNIHSFYETFKDTIEGTSGKVGEVEHVNKLSYKSISEYWDNLEKKEGDKYYDTYENEYWNNLLKNTLPTSLWSKLRGSARPSRGGGGGLLGWLPWGWLGLGS